MPSFDGGRGRVWQVYAHRDEVRIMTRAPTQGKAWEAAAEQARRLEQQQAW